MPHNFDRVQRKSEAIRYGEGMSHEAAVIDLGKIFERGGYFTKKDATIHNNTGLCCVDVGGFPANFAIDGSFFRLDLMAFKRLDQNPWIVLEVQGGRHEKKIVKSKDGIKMEDVIRWLEPKDPIYIQVKIYTITGPYALSEEEWQQIVRRPYKKHMEMIS